MKIFTPQPAIEPLSGQNVQPDRGGWLILGLSRLECSGIGQAESHGGLTRAETVNSLEGLACPGIDAIVVLSPPSAAQFPESAANLLALTEGCASWVTVLLPWQEPPVRSMRPDGTADSFCCSAGVFAQLLRSAPGTAIENLCFRLLDGVMEGDVEVERVLVRQLPLERPSAMQENFPDNAAVVMAHRGPKRFLAAALRFIMCAAGGSQLTVRVGLDVDDVDEYQDLVERYPQVEFYAVEGAPVGPYVIRQALIERSTERLIIFHDSDDISCYDRFVTQAAAIAADGVGAVGSHELRVNELSRCMEFYRFPLDATAALALPGSTERNDRANEPLLHPTLTMVRRAFVEAGGFSTNRKIANDTQFMLRAYFSMRMRNVDNCLYLRRKHSNALTVSKETALGTPLRHYLGTTWGADFEAVKNGRARLEETSLRPHLSPVPARLTRLSPAAETDLRRRA